jgi:hypothetical protein
VLQVSAGIQCLYEAQMSVTITGLDHRIWTAYGVFDTCHKWNEIADFYYNESFQTNRIVDPLADGLPLWNNLPPTPRE